MQILLERIEKEAAKVGLKINVSKSKEMRIAMNNNETLYIHSETIERVTQFAHLGSIIDNTGGTEADITARIRKAQTAFSAIKRSGTQRRTQRKPNFASSIQKRDSSPTVQL
jgi:hypothetical protein